MLLNSSKIYKGVCTLYTMEHERFSTQGLEAFMASGLHARSDIVRAFASQDAHTYSDALGALSTFGYDVMLRPLSTNAITLGCLAYATLC